MDLIDRDFINSGGLYEFMNELGTIQCKENKRKQELLEEEAEYNREHGIERAEFNRWCFEHSC